MKKLLLFFLLFCSVRGAYCQAYIPMPADSGATWRYRFNDIDMMVQVTDEIIYLDGTDTISGGRSYHKAMGRSCRQTGPLGFYPPIVSVECNLSQSYAGAMRESGKKVYWLWPAGEEDLIYDFNAAVGDSIPSYNSKVMVTAIDSVLLDGVFHKRYKTTDTGYYVIEGVGSSRGLIPGLDDGSANTQFFCFTDSALVYEPDTTVPCTTVYPFGFHEGVLQPGNEELVSITPNPASHAVQLAAPGKNRWHVAAYNYTGQRIWQGDLQGNAEVSVAEWPRGVYVVRFDDTVSQPIMKIIIVN